MSKRLTVLVNSTDSFEDCWQPFFRLFSIYWPRCPYPAVLNTETKDFTSDDKTIDLRCSRIGEGWTGPSRIPWSDCLIRCLDQLESEYILYLQDDYFLNGRVDEKLIEEFIDVMAESGAAHLRLMETDRKAAHSQSKLHPLLWEINPRANYRISMQAGLWRKDALRAYLQPGESGWQFERAGTRRSYLKHDLFLCQNLDEFNAKGRFVLPYWPTGIIKGKWYESAVVELFKQHGIEVDYSRRGFYRPSIWRRMLIPVRAYIRRWYMRLTWLYDRINLSTKNSIPVK